MHGDYKEFSNLPHVNTYKYHKSKKKKLSFNHFSVLKEVIRLLNSNNTNDFLPYTQKVSDEDLYEYCFTALQRAIPKPKKKIPIRK